MYDEGNRDVRPLKWEVEENKTLVALRLHFELNAKLRKLTYSQWQCQCLLALMFDSILNRQLWVSG